MLQALSPPGFHALEILGGLSCPLDDARPQNLFRLAALLGEGHRGQQLKQGVASSIQRGAGEDGPLGLDNLLIRPS